MVQGQASYTTFYHPLRFNKHDPLHIKTRRLTKVAGEHLSRKNVNGTPRRTPRCSVCGPCIHRGPYRNPSK